MRQKPLILLVDDEEMFLEIASVKLSDGGFETVLAKGAKEAFFKASDLLPDLVLSDIYMPPGPTGWELAMELRRSPKTHEILIAFFTSLKDPWSELRAEREEVERELGAVTFLSKTEDVDALPERILQLIK